MSFNWWTCDICLYNLSRSYHHLLAPMHSYAINESSQCYFVPCESVLAIEQTHTAHITSECSQQSIMAPCYVTNSSVLNHRNCLTLFLVSPTSFPCQSDNPTILRMDKALHARKINYITARRVGKLSIPQSIFLTMMLEMKWRGSYVQYSMKHQLFLGAMEFLRILYIPVEFYCSCLQPYMKSIIFVCMLHSFYVVSYVRFSCIILRVVFVLIFLLPYSVMYI